MQQAYGSLPAGWHLEKLKFYASVRNSNVDKTISDDEEPVQLCNYTDVYYNDRITRDLEFMQGSATESEIEKFQLKRGQVIITKDSEGWDDIGIPALVTEDMPDVLCGYHLSVFEPGPDLDGAFLAWLCRSDPLNDQFKLGANGVTRYGLGQYPMKNALVALPPIESQRRIARFLDEKTAQIDGLIEKKRALLDGLAEKRQVLITRAVTKGLNPDAPMKPSGIDWLGDIPAHWELLPLKRLLADGIGLQMGPFGGMLTNLPDYETGFKLYGQENTISGDFTRGRRWVEEERFNELKRYQLVPGDLVITRKGSLGSCRRVPDGIQPGITDSDTIRIRPNHSRLLSEWALALLHEAHFVSEQISAERRGAILSGLNTTVVGNLLFTAPPVDEQNRILRFLSRTLSRDDIIVAKVKETIARLVEYRSALITAAVTGMFTEAQ
ncbi:restriction endonuclease subunit S [Jannaschia ovalis]|uniref:Restriction endonuclease subunit S n=1 Tax=Jannaschia ovalis TaxID=3038773 RepID=A0ABY8LE75_9RHOB|nr:restriction endonuclease subunit S [Jannaschia sp. GRR-S6-38]WGH78600.1 restriction endonuclease subunit S [Jannaschia sp. GRR-S6-38]